MSVDPPLDRYYKPPFDEARTAKAWRGIAARRRAAPAASRRWVIAATCAALVAAAVVAAAWPSTAVTAPLASRDPAVSVAPGTIWSAGAQPLVLDDDSRIELSGEARLQVLANEGTRFATLLQTGSARFDVRPGGPRRWEIETSLASVEVVGTAFTVSVRDHQLEVQVERGVVLVHGEQVTGRVVRLTAGERLVVAAPVVSAVVPSPSPPPVLPPPVAPPPPPPPPPPRRLASSAPVPTVVAAPPPLVPLADAVAAADRLRSAGDPAGAAALLEGVRNRPGDPASGLVSFTLGRLYLDALGEPERAAAAFDEVIARGNPRSLLEDAHARSVEAWARAHRPERAAAAFAAYATAYPQGRRLVAVRALLESP